MRAATEGWPQTTVATARQELPRPEEHQHHGSDGSVGSSVTPCYGSDENAAILFSGGTINYLISPASDRD